MLVCIRCTAGGALEQELCELSEKKRRGVAFDIGSAAFRIVCTGSADDRPAAQHTTGQKDALPEEALSCLSSDCAALGGVRGTGIVAGSQELRNPGLVRSGSEF